MERLEEAVLCLKSVVYSNLTLSANRTRSLPSFTQGHTGIPTHSFTYIVASLSTYYTIC